MLLLISLQKKEFPNEESMFIKFNISSFSMNLFFKVLQLRSVTRSPFKITNKFQMMKNVNYPMWD